MRRDSVDRELTTELIVGTFMVLMLIALVYFTIVLGRANLFQKQYPFEVEFAHVMELRKDDNVVLRGMTIGKIKSLRLVGDRVRVLALLERPVTLRKDYRIKIVATSILGGRYLEIEEGSPGAEPLPEGIMPQGAPPYDVMTEAADVVHEIRSALREGGILTNVQMAVASLREIADKINRGEGTMGKLVNDDALYQEVQAAVRDLRGVAEQVREVVDKVGRGEGTMGKLLADETVYRDLQTLTSNLKDVSQRLVDGQGVLGKLLAPDDTLYRDAAAAAASLKAVAAKIERGEGLLGRLTQDDSLYTEVQAAVREVRAAIDDYRETSPVVSFTSLLFGAF